MNTVSDKTAKKPSTLSSKVAPNRKPQRTARFADEGALRKEQEYEPDLAALKRLVPALSQKLSTLQSWGKACKSSRVNKDINKAEKKKDELKGKKLTARETVSNVLKTGYVPTRSDIEAVKKKRENLRAQKDAQNERIRASEAKKEAGSIVADELVYWEGKGHWLKTMETENKLTQENSEQLRISLETRYETVKTKVEAILFPPTTSDRSAVPELPKK